MILAIDIGNTNTVFGIFDYNGNLKGSFRAETRHNITIDEYNAFLTPCLEKIDTSYSDFNRIVISSVVPQVKYQTEKFCENYILKSPFFIEEKIEKLGVKIEIDNPNEVGADRIVNVISAYSKYKESMIIIDFGTATTFDIVSENGSYLGGVIAPGINLSLKALQENASKLPEISISRPDKAIGKSTKSAMQSGIYYGYLGLIENIVKELSQEIGKKPVVIATGGLAKFYESSPFIDKIEEDLTLQGLYLIATNNN